MSVKAASPKCPEELTADWLTTSLQAGGALTSDAHVADFIVTVLGEGAGLMGTVVRITPRWEGPAGPESFVGKFSTTNPDNQNVAAAFDLYGREVRFYTDVARGMRGRFPTCYYAELSDDSRGCVLLLEDFPQHRTGDQVVGATLAEARSVMIEAARLHSSYWDAARPATVGRFGAEWSPFLRAGAAASWAGMVQRHADVMPDYLQSLGDEYVGKVEVFHNAMSDGLCTVVQGDLRQDNLLFDREPNAADPVVMIDFQNLQWGKGALDLAYFLTQSFDVELRRNHERDLLEAYRAELARLGVAYGANALWEDYRMAALAVFAIGVMITGLAPTTERAARFQRVTVQRASVAFDDLGLLALLRKGI